MKKNSKIQLYTTCGVVGLTTLAGIGLVLLTPTSATDNVDVVTVTIPASCTLTSTETAAHTKSITSGTTETGIGTTTFKVACNDASGYAIYAVGYTNDTAGTTYMAAGSPLTSTYNIATGTSGSSSYWAMQLTGTDATIVDAYKASNYAAIPSTNTKVAYKTAGTYTEATAFTSTYKVFVSSTQPAGTYT